ncbi:MDR family MFS transporter [Oceanobacillus alkalisoli]|uniref:MDR family MFS transporter n=1 Tax=Oceanobacillus alkalisoli TaxID=2925113 RepID=UPI001EF00762|nr:MDR family MFS transporter [Oceanobacillus alkalisoli]MCF3941964.1 DHA2 family efflux MFS transporter permease subunit [Oceanobacillus alkalisoli]MCG5102083.1 DHA2 family efflux MFS transporter permease subunit [Oceanobacillus alkalisoli]
MGDNLSKGQDIQNFNRVPLVIVLISGAFVAILNQTLLGTALPKIMIDLELTENTVQWLQSVFMLVNGIMIPITAFLIGRFTTRTLFLTAMSLFSLGTFTAAISGSFELLLLGRIFQAAGAGIMMPLMQTILMLIFPIEKRGTAMGMFGLVIAFAPAIGPTLSGYIVEVASWRWLFWMILPIAIIDIILAYFVLKNVTKQTKPRLDVLSIILSTFGFGGILYAFSMAGSAGWGSAEVLLGFGVGIITLVWFITRQFKLDEPILEFRVMKYKMFTITTIIGMITFIAVIGAAIVLPLYMQTMLGFSAFESGLALLAGAIIQGLLNPITGRMFDRFGARWLAVSGMLILTVSTFMFAVLTPETSFTYIAVTHALRMVSISMVMMPVTTAGLNVLPMDLISHGTAVNNTLRQVSGSIGTALPITIMTTFTIPEEGIEGMIHGVNISFVFAGIISLIGFIMSFYIKDRKV